MGYNMGILFPFDGCTSRAQELHLENPIQSPSIILAMINLRSWFESSNYSTLRHCNPCYASQPAAATPLSLDGLLILR